MLSDRSQTKSQRNFQFSCQLLIQQFKVSHTGYLYFIWLCGNKQAQSLNYNTTSSSLTQVRQTLSLGLNLYSKDERFMQKLTTLLLLNDHGEQLEKVQLNVDEWPVNFRQVTIRIRGGFINARLRRKRIMQVQYMEDAQEQNYQEVFNNRRGGRAKTMVQMRQQVVYGKASNEYNSPYINKGKQSFTTLAQQLKSEPAYKSYSNQQLIEQLFRVKKQLQDKVYLNNKLKNDRDILMKKEQSLEHQTQVILVTVSQDIKDLRQHYDRRVSLQQQIYGQQIQQMMIMVNGSQEYSKELIGQIQRQKAQLQEENREIAEQSESVRLELDSYKQRYQTQLRALNEQMKRNVDQSQRKNQAKVEVIQAELKTRNQEAETVSMQVRRQKQHMQNQLQECRFQCQKYKLSNNSLRDQLTEQIKKNGYKTVSIQQKLQQQLQKSAIDIKSLSQTLQAQQGLTSRLKGQVLTLQAETEHSSQQLRSLGSLLRQKDCRISELQVQLLQITCQLQFNEDAHRQLQAQHQEKQRQIYDQLQCIEVVYNEKMEQYVNRLNKQKSHMQSQLMERQAEIQAVRQVNQKQLLRKQSQERIKLMEQQPNVEKDGQLARIIKQLEEKLHFAQKKRQQSQIKIRAYEEQLLNIKINGYPATSSPKDGNLSQQQTLILLNRSTQMSQCIQTTRDKLSVDHEFSLAQFNTIQQLEQEINRKQGQIRRLKDKIKQMTGGQCNQLQSKLRQTHSIQLVEYCDSEKEEQEQINKNQIRRRVVLNALDTNYKNTQSPNNLHSHNPNNTQIPLQKPKTTNKGILPNSSNFNYTRKNQPYLIRLQSMGLSKDLQLQSNTSYIKVSHNQKLKQQQQLIQQYQERQQNHKKEIQGYIQKIQLLAKEIEKMRHELEESGVALDQLRSLRLVNHSQKKQIQDKSKSLVQMREQLNQIQPQLQHLRSIKPQIQQQLKYLTKSLNQSNQCSVQLQIKLKQSQSRVEQSQQFYKKSNQQQKDSKKVMGQLEQKLREFKQHQQEVRMQNRELMFVNQQISNQLKEYKLMYEDLQDKMMKHAGTDVMIKELHKQIQECNKRNMQQVRMLNHLKLQKENLDEQMTTIKKRHGQQTRVTIQCQQKALSLATTIDQYKRQKSKLKHQLQQSQQDVHKMRNQVRRFEEQLNTLKTLSISVNYEKKKFLEELAQTGEQIMRKQHQNSRLLQQLQKYRHMVKESEESRTERKSQLRYQIEKLQSQVVRKDKKIIQIQEQLKILKGSFQSLQRENRRLVEGQTQTYGDKIKHYVDEMASIKKVLDEQQAQNIRLKLKNKEFIGQNQLLKLSYNQLQKNYVQMTDNQTKIMKDLQHYMDESNMISKRNNQYQIQLDHLQQTNYQINKQLCYLKTHNNRMTQHLQSTQEINCHLMQQVKRKISQLQMRAKIHCIINQKYNELDIKYVGIQEQLKKMKHCHEIHMKQFIYKQQDMHKLSQEIKNRLSQEIKNRLSQEIKIAYINKKQQTNTAIDHISKTKDIKINKLQTELLKTLNQKSKLSNELLLMSDKLDKQKLQTSQIQAKNRTILQLQNTIRQLTQEVVFNKEEVKIRDIAMFKEQLDIKELRGKVDSKQVQLVRAVGRIDQLQVGVQKLGSKILVLQQEKEGLHGQISQLIQRDKDKTQLITSQQEARRINQKQKQNIERRLFQVQLLLEKLKQDTLTLQYSMKIKSLQYKLSEMSKSMSEYQGELEKHYEQGLLRTQQQIIKLSQQLQDRLIRTDEMSKVITNLQLENQQIAKELSTTRYKLDQQTSIFNMQYSKLKQRLTDKQQAYNDNLKSLEGELMHMGKQLASAKHNRSGQSTSESRLRGSQVEQTKRTVRRMQQKLRTKDTKIQELRQNIQTLEQSLLELRQKQSSRKAIYNELQTLRTQNIRLQVQFKQVTEVNQSELRSQQNQIISYEQHLALSKMALDQKIMQLSSVQYELTSVKDLYSQLQRWVDRRQLNIPNQVQGYSRVVLQLKNKQVLINGFRQEMKAFTVELSSLKSQNRKITQELKQQRWLDGQSSVKNRNIAKLLRETQTTNTLMKQELKQSGQKNITLEAQVKSLKKSFQKIKISNEGAKTQLIRVYEQIGIYTKDSEAMQVRIRDYEQIVSKFKKMDHIAHRQLGVSIQQLIKQGNFIQAFGQKQSEVNQLIEQLAQLKFLSNRKLLQYDQLKKQNYELALKAQDNKILTQQVQNLRTICEKLQQQRKQAIFKEQLIRMHLVNMIQSSQHDNQSKLKIKQILRNSAATNLTGGVQFIDNSFGVY